MDRRADRARWRSFTMSFPMSPSPRSEGHGAFGRKRMQPPKAIPMSLTSAMPWGEMVASAVGAGGLTQFLNWLTNRQKAQAYTQGFVDRAMEKALQGVSDQLSRADIRIQAVEAHRDQCERELEDGRRERAELLSRLDDLMSGRVAAVGQPPPRVP